MSRLVILRLLSAFIGSVLLVSRVLALACVTYNADTNQQAADPVLQGWSISGDFHAGVDDSGTLAWELNDRTSRAVGPTMSADFGAAMLPQPGDFWTFTVHARVLPGNGQATNVIMWSDGSRRYLFFVYENSAGALSLRYWNKDGRMRDLENLALNDGAYHVWAIRHDGTTAKLTYDGADVVDLGMIPAGAYPRGVYVGGGTSAGVGALYVASASFEVSLAAGARTTQLGRVFADHMVLQRDMPVTVFGHDSVNPGAQEVRVFYAGQEKSTITDAAGNWQVTLDPMAAEARGRELMVSGSSNVRIRDILVGEVWLAAGQSNMNHSVSSSSRVNTPDPSRYPLIRMCNWEGVVGTGSSTVYSTADLAKLTSENFYAGTWQVMDANTVRPQSAVAYYFAEDLAASLSVPIGIVDISYGGTSTEAFISPGTCRSDPKLQEAFERPHLTTRLGQWTAPRILKNLYNNNPDHYTHPDASKPHPHPYAPGFLYAAGLSHLTDFTFRGGIWYQGESNAEFTNGKYQIEGDRLSEDQCFVMKTMIADWRAAFERPDFPVYMVQLPRIKAPNRVLWPFYREAQARVAAEMEGVELARIMEYGDDGPNVHPINKQPVGKRLAAIARAKLYGEDIVYSGPVYRGHRFTENKVILEFDHIGESLMDIDGGKLRNFEVAGPDRKFLRADAKIVGDTVEVSSESVMRPIAVRHAWDMNAYIDLYNANGFSGSSFRTY